MYKHGRRKYPVQFLLIPFSEFKCNETTYGGGQCGRNQRERPDKAPHDIIDTVVFHTKGIQYDSWGVQRCEQAKRQTNVEYQGVFGYPFGICVLCFQNSDSFISKTLSSTTSYYLRISLPAPHQYTAHNSNRYAPFHKSPPQSGKPPTFRSPINKSALGFLQE